ncbi:hypothetical protein VNO78_17660 [Psophocarpus tetragonolobus]|uniref:Uncharacterized protein n=1 Tax=Psophocarpus tetragonolobus TaxID=3891 RepID=A0AAN9XLI0_PSOTE
MVGEYESKGIQALVDKLVSQDKNDLPFMQRKKKLNPETCLEPSQPIVNRTRLSFSPSSPTHIYVALFSLQCVSNSQGVSKIYLACLAPCMPFAEPISTVVALTNGVRGAMHYYSLVDIFCPPTSKDHCHLKVDASTDRFHCCLVYIIENWTNAITCRAYVSNAGQMIVARVCLTRFVHSCHEYLWGVLFN